MDNAVARQTLFSLAIMTPSATKYNGLMVASPPDPMSLGAVVFLISSSISSSG